MIAPPADLSAIYGTPIACADTLPVANAYGVVNADTREMILRRDLCQRLALLHAGAVSRRDRVNQEFSQALFVLGHELAHVAGVVDEHEADCAGVRNLRSVAVRLGVAGWYARFLSRLVPSSICGRPA